MDEQILGTNTFTWKLMLASIAVLLTGIFYLAVRRRRTGTISWSGFVLTMFAAVLLYDIGLWQLAGESESILLAIFHSIQTMSANRDFELPDVPLSEMQAKCLATYGTILFIVAPVSIVTAVLEYFSGALSSIVLRFRSLLSDSFVFSYLDERTLDLAQEIRANYRKGPGLLLARPCIAFASSAEADEELLDSARKMGAACFDDDVIAVAGLCSRRTICSIVLLDDDEVSAITTARKVRNEALGRRSLVWEGETRILVLTDFRDTEPLLFPEALREEQLHRGESRAPKVLIRGIDLTRELIEQVILRYPIFLLSKPEPGVSMPPAVDAGEVDEGLASTCWYRCEAGEIAEARRRELYQRQDRHILVVGAGEIGTEFLSSVLWASRIDGLHTRIDVIDNVEDPLCPGRPLAKSLYAAKAPEIMEMSRASANAEEEPYDLTFSLIDAETDAYAQFLADRASTVSYVFISLGDDLLDARVAMHTRQILERGLAQTAKDRSEFLAASRPLIVTVIRNDDFAITVERAECEGQPYDIVCVGNNSDILTYQMLEDLMDSRTTEYKRRSSRASSTHVKYRLFAFARNLLLNRHRLREAFAQELEDQTIKVLCDTLDISAQDAVLRDACAAFGGSLSDQKVMDLLSQVDWTVDVKGGEDECQKVKKWPLALLYQLYCTNGVTRALASQTPADPSRTWLLRMEHDRWNAYVRTQGFVKADWETTERIFATGQIDTQKHRSNLMGLHPCLVSFDALTVLDLPLYHMYEQYFSELGVREVGLSKGEREARLKVAKADWLQLLDDNYIGIKRPKYQ